MMYPSFAEDSHHPRQHRFSPSTHVQWLDRQPHGVNTNHRSNPRNHELQAAAAASGQLTFTIVAPRRSSITISCATPAAGLDISTGTNAAFACNELACEPFPAAIRLASLAC